MFQKFNKLKIWLNNSPTQFNYLIKGIPRQLICKNSVKSASLLTTRSRDASTA